MIAKIKLEGQLEELVKASAEENCRSISSEILYIIKQVFLNNRSIDDLKATIPVTTPVSITTTTIVEDPVEEVEEEYISMDALNF